jgi:hypothetical protein
MEPELGSVAAEMALVVAEACRPLEIYYGCMARVCMTVEGEDALQKAAVEMITQHCYDTLHRGDTPDKIRPSRSRFGPFIAAGKIFAIWCRQNQDVVNAFGAKACKVSKTMARQQTMRWTSAGLNPLTLRNPETLVFNHNEIVAVAQSTFELDFPDTQQLSAAVSASLHVLVVTRMLGGGRARGFGPMYERHLQTLNDQKTTLDERVQSANESDKSILFAGLLHECYRRLYLPRETYYGCPMEQQFRDSLYHKEVTSILDGLIHAINSNVCIIKKFPSNGPDFAKALAMLVETMVESNQLVPIECTSHFEVRGGGGSGAAGNSVAHLSMTCATTVAHWVSFLCNPLAALKTLGVADDAMSKYLRAKMKQLMSQSCK